MTLKVHYGSYNRQHKQQKKIILRLLVILRFIEGHELLQRRKI